MSERPSLHALALYLAAVERGTITAAAEAERISQPAVSVHLKALERFYGTPLMERSGRRVRPTAAGRLVADSVRRVLELLDELQRAVADLEGLRAGRLEVGASATVGETVLPAVLGRFRRAHPAVELVLRIGNSEEILRAVRARELGLGVVGQPGADGTVTAEPVLDDALELVVPAASPLLRRAPVRLADLAGESIVLREPGSATRDLALRCLEARGFVPARTMELGSNEAVKRAVAAGLGVGILSTHTLDVDRRAGDLAPLPCADWDCRRRFWLVRRADRPLGPAERAFRLLLGPPGVLSPTGPGATEADAHA